MSDERKTEIMTGLYPFILSEMSLKYGCSMEDILLLDHENGVGRAIDIAWNIATEIVIAETNKGVC